MTVVKAFHFHNNCNTCSVLIEKIDMVSHGLLKGLGDPNETAFSEEASTISDGFVSPVSSSMSLMSEAMDDVITANLPLMSPTHVDLNEWVWRYRGEGGANLVISLLDEQRGTRKVARFSKSKYKDKDNDAKIDETAFYANSVMGPLLGARFVRPVTIGVVDEDDFEAVRTETLPYRPVERCKKDIRSRKVISSPDCVFLDENHILNTFGDTFSIEVKPKQGWHQYGQTQLCHRCLKQKAKLHQGEIDTISRYCPLELFSGDLERMKRALFDLYDNPHNRFKIFKNGQLIYTEKKGQQADVDHHLGGFFGDSNSRAAGAMPDGSGINNLAAVLCSVLLGQAKASEELISLVPRKKPQCQNKCDTSAKPLPKGCILDVLLSLQKNSGDVNDIGAKALSEKLLGQVKDIEELHTLAVWYPLTTASTLSAKVLEEQLGYSNDFIRDLRRLQRFLLSVTAKDVSLLITFRAVNDPNAEQSLHLPTVLCHGRLLRVMISVIDLDPKPVHRIPTWIERREEWLNIYLKS